MTKQYGAKKGKQVFYASRNAGKIMGVDKGFYGHMNTSSMRSSPIKTTGGLHMGHSGGMGMGRHMKGIKMPSLKGVR